MKKVMCLFLFVFLAACGATAPTPTAPVKEQLVHGSPISKPTSSQFVYLGFLPTGKSFVYDAAELTFAVSPDGKMILARRTSRDMYHATEMTGTYQYNDIQFVPLGNGVDVWSSNQADGYIDSTLPTPTCVGVYEDTVYALIDKMRFGLFEKHFSIDSMCKSNGHLEVFRQDFPQVCDAPAFSTHYAHPDQPGYCTDDKTNAVLASWQYPSSSVMYP